MANAINPLERSRPIDVPVRQAFWEQTMDLRLLRVGKKRARLQQRYLDRANNAEEWRDVPEVEDDRTPETN